MNKTLWLNKILVIASIFLLPNIAKSEIQIGDYLRMEAGLLSGYQYQSSDIEKQSGSYMRNEFFINSEAMYKTQYFSIGSTQGLNLWLTADGDDVVYDINLGLIMGSEYAGYLTIGYDELLSDKLATTVGSNKIGLSWKQYYHNASKQSVGNDRYMVYGYRTPTLYGLTAYASLAAKGSSDFDETSTDSGLASAQSAGVAALDEVFSNRDSANLMRSATGLDLLDTHSKSIKKGISEKYFTPVSKINATRGGMFEAGANYALNIEDTYKIVADFSVLYGDVEFDMNKANYVAVAKYLGLKKDDLKDNFTRIKLGGAATWNLNSTYLDAIDVSFAYTNISATSNSFAHSAAIIGGNINIGKAAAGSGANFSTFDFYDKIVKDNKINNSAAAAAPVVEIYKLTDWETAVDAVEVIKADQNLGGAKAFLDQLRTTDIAQAGTNTSNFNVSSITKKFFYYDKDCSTGTTVTCTSAQKTNIETVSNTLIESAHKIHYDVLLVYAGEKDPNGVLIPGTEGTAVLNAFENSIRGNSPADLISMITPDVAYNTDTYTYFDKLNNSSLNDKSKLLVNPATTTGTKIYDWAPLVTAADASAITDAAALGGTNSSGVGIAGNVKDFVNQFTVEQIIEAGKGSTRATLGAPAVAGAGTGASTPAVAPAAATIVVDLVAAKIDEANHAKLYYNVDTCDPNPAIATNTSSCTALQKTAVVAAHTDLLNAMVNLRYQIAYNVNTAAFDQFNTDFNNKVAANTANLARVHPTSVLSTNAVYSNASPSIIANSVDINKFSDTMSHVVEMGLKVEKMGIFLDNSLNFMMGEQALYENNGQFDTAKLVEYSLINVGVTAGYAFNSLLLADDALNLYVNMIYSSINLVKDSTDMVFGFGVQYDL